MREAEGREEMLTRVWVVVIAQMKSMLLQKVLL